MFCFVLLQGSTNDQGVTPCSSLRNHSQQCLESHIGFWRSIWFIHIQGKHPSPVQSHSEHRLYICFIAISHLIYYMNITKICFPVSSLSDFFISICLYDSLFHFVLLCLIWCVYGRGMFNPLAGSQFFLALCLRVTSGNQMKCQGLNQGKTRALPLILSLWSLYSF